MIRATECAPGYVDSALREKQREGWRFVDVVSRGGDYCLIFDDGEPIEPIEPKEPTHD